MSFIKERNKGRGRKQLYLKKVKTGKKRKR